MKRLAPFVTTPFKYRPFRWIPLAFCLPFLLSCEREIFIIDPGLIVDGYEIQGYVYDPVGNPIPGVKIYLEYDVAVVDFNPPPSKVYQVPSPGEQLTIRVVIHNGQLYRTLATVNASAGSFSYDWNFMTGSGEPAAPGLYYVRYISGSSIRHEYPVIVTGTLVTQTNDVGAYTISNDHLPIDFYPVPEYSSGQTFFGNGRITTRVYLTFESTFGSLYRSVDVVRDQVVLFDARFH